MGVDQKTVSRDLGKNSVMTEKMPKQPRTRICYQINQGTVSNDLVINSVMTEKTTKQPRTRICYQINQGLVQASHRGSVDIPQALLLHGFQQSAANALTAFCECLSLSALVYSPVVTSCYHGEVHLYSSPFASATRQHGAIGRPVQLVNLG